MDFSGTKVYKPTAGTDCATKDIGGATFQGILLADASGNVIGSATHPVRTDPTGTTAQPVSATALPLPTGAATSAKQPALGTAGTPSSDVLTVQGVASGTPLFVSAKIWDTVSNAYVGLPFAAGQPIVTAQDYLLAVAEGDITGHTPWSKIGLNDTIGTTQETMWTYSSEYVFPTAAGQIEVASSDNTQDKAGGTGALTVRVGYLKSDYTESSVTLTLNGTTYVASGASHADIWRVNSFRVMTTGTNLSPVGNLTLRQVTGGLVVGYIRAGKTRARTCVYTVPAAKTLYVTSIAFSASGTKYLIFTTHANYDSATAALLQRGLFHPFSEISLLNSSYSKTLEMPTKLPATTDLKVSVVAEAAGSLATCHLRGWLE